MPGGFTGAPTGYGLTFLEAAAGKKQPQAAKYAETVLLLYWIRENKLIRDSPITETEIWVEPGSMLRRIKW